ncbi:MAG: cytochrome c [Gammaproteobacteria bacterium]|nr:cytochrome c [Gammaproteobacteria bacterium]
MFNSKKIIIVVMAILSIGWISTYAQEPAVLSEELHLSEDLRALLREEMQEIATASQAVVLSLATGDWKSIEHISEKIRASYVMERKLSASQRRELEEQLPEHFKKLDMEFHARAEKLGLAAAARDPEIVAFQYYRLVESCTVCHAAFAKTRFPGFLSNELEIHHH